MGKMGELAAQLSELKRCGEILIGISDSLSELFSGGDAEEKEGGAGGAAAKKGTVKKGAEPAATPTEPEPEEKPLTLEMMRAVLAEKSRAGHTDEVRALLEKHGASKLSGIDPVEYPALLAEVEVL